MQLDDKFVPPTLGQHDARISKPGHLERCFPYETCVCFERPEVEQTFEDAIDVVLASMKKLMVDRQRKYGPNNILSGGVHGLIIRLGDKLARIQEDHKDCLFLGECKQRTLPDEDTLDAWYDLANYAGPIAIMLQGGTWERPLAQ